jgi:hypothetical protein
MNSLRHAALIILFLAPAWAWGQAASKAEQDVVLEIAQCIVEGAPEDWTRLTMVVDLDKPGADTGGVRYLVTRSSSEEPVSYLPCDQARPARLLIESRGQLAPERQGWTGARLVLQRDGRFSLNYDYP